MRFHLQRPEEHSHYARAGVDVLAGVREWIAAGVIDTVSGDDVAYLAGLVAEARMPVRLSA